MNRQLSELVDAGKGVAIILVVIGHVPGRLEHAPPFLQASKDIIYLFHMPLFMCLAGVASGFTSARLVSLPDYAGFVWRKFERLMVPYCTLSVAYFVLQWVAQSFMHFKRPIDLQLILTAFVDPGLGPMGPLWFLYVLFEVSVLYYALEMVVKSPGLWCVVSVALVSVSWPQMFGIASTFHLLPFFALGRLCCEHAILEKWNPWIGLVTTSLVFCAASHLATPLVSQPYVSLLIAAAGSFACLSAVRLIQGFGRHHLLALIGRYSMAIYVLHLLVLVLFFRLNWYLNGADMPLLGTVSVALGGFFIPITLVERGIAKSRLLTTLLLGKPVRTG
ncbi:MAG: acyltransferase [Desulfomonile tiedjei]|nr:acyltransferase [Desulfomonile tiedjei]